MDIHRCRFVPYPVSAINAIAFTHSNLPKSAKKSQKPRLAIGRANGDVEIWNPNNGAWHQELAMPGGKDRSVDGLVWVTDPDEEMQDGTIFHGKSRLFSIGYTTAITEYDLEKGRVKKHASGQHGDIWCLGVQPPPTNKDKTPRKLVAGTVDGNLLLYSIEGGDLEFERAVIRTPSNKTKMVSIAFQSKNCVVVGCSDSTIRVYDISRRGGTLRAQMTLGSDHSSSSSKTIIVWAVKCLPNGDIVSGDSTGHLCIWDGRTYTQTQRIQGHTQDILCLAASADGSQIVSGSMDGRIVFYEPTPRQPGRWSKVFHRRHDGHHDGHHDVKAMASYEAKGMSVVVCGGSKANPVVLPLRGVGKENHRNLPHLPQTTNIRSASRARLMMSWWGNELRIWELHKPATKLLADATTHVDMKKNRRLVAQLVVKGESSITSAAISEDGNLVVVSTTSDIKAFRLEYHPKSSSPHPELKKLSMPATGNGASKVEISPDAKWMCWVEEGRKVMIAGINKSEGRYEISKPYKLNRLARRVPKTVLLGGLGMYDRNVTQVTFSPDSKMLAVADLAGFVDTWVLRDPGAKSDASSEVEEESSSGDSSDEEADQTDGEQWTRNPKAALIFRLPSAPVVLSFSKACLPTDKEDGDYLLLAITTLKQIFLFNPLHGSLADWSRRNTYWKLPETFRITRDLAKGVVWQGPRVWIYGSSFLFMLDLSQDLVPESADGPKDGVQSGSKRKRDHEHGAGGRMDKQQVLTTDRVKVATGPPEEVAWMDVDMVEADDSISVGASSGIEDDEDDDDDEDETDGGELQRFRDEAVNGDDSAHGKAGATRRRAKWWNTYQYQPILGIVPFQKTSEEQEQNQENGVSEEKYPPLEVVLVERPIWDADPSPH
ncbi:WD40 repeat-like protein [Rhypophila decipiens]|uniref:WD40 repeat-like protein n=1 Tax=Rhypophila decipiens TaxID=261697 RepID=A0AAN7B0N6_9PEZI|nr:WD40 repeat-like protein [Rhypophila decipiens]